MEIGTVLGVCLLFAFWSDVAAKPQDLLKQTNKTLGQVDEKSAGSLSDLEHALSILTNLTVAQKEVLEQQKRQELLIKEKNREGEERESIRTRALEEEQRILRELKAKISRKIKSLNKNSPDGITRIALDGLPNQILPKDCADVYLNFDEETSDVYRIWPVWTSDRKGILVYCDMDTDGGGWTVVHRWGNYGLWRDYYKKSWNEYKSGFGDLTNAFWLGTEQIYALTSQGPYSIRLDFETTEGKEYSTYDTFWVENEYSKYKFHVDTYDRTKGKAGDLLTTLNNTDFTTWDRNSQCTTQLHQRPAWWYPQNCILDSKLRLTTVPQRDGTTEKKEIKIRPANFLRMKGSG